MKTRAALCLVGSVICAGGAIASAALVEWPSPDVSSADTTAWSTDASPRPPTAPADEPADGSWPADAAADHTSDFPHADVPLVAGPRRTVSAESTTSRDGLVTERWRVHVHPATPTWRRTAAMSLTRAGYISSGRVRALEGQATAVWMSRGPISVHYDTSLTLTGAIVYTVDRRTYIDAR